MSTFDGFISEFPDICIDHFRPSTQRPPPLAGFLSHVHTDHTIGLETWRSPFIYCSAATKAILLRLERYPHRMNFAKGVLEARHQHFRHLRKVLRPVPLDRPTVLEISPGRSIRFTLLDANHCSGAVMFLLESAGTAVLYTGDIRCEAWWLEKLTRSPALLPYFAIDGQPGLKRLDRVYLDTTFVAEGKADAFREFPTKLAGVQELLQKMQRYPDATRFYFDSWTFGYEDVWDVVAQAFGAQIHLDPYRFGLYRALADGAEACRAPEAAVFLGHAYGNHYQAGIVTSNQDVRIHSCEKGTGCEIWKQDFVRITPIITRYNGMDVEELGAGGGKGDLDQRFEVEMNDQVAIQKLMSMCASKLSGQPQIVLAVLAKLQAMIQDPVDVLELDVATLRHDDLAGETSEMVDIDQLPIEKLLPALVEMVHKNKDDQRINATSGTRIVPTPARTITFPYSRHSSYAELCMLIDRLRPIDIYPCTVAHTDWSPRRSMAFLFGHLYNHPVSFAHDQSMLHAQTEANETVRGREITQSLEIRPVLHLPEHEQTTPKKQEVDLECAESPGPQYDLRILQRQQAYEAALGDGDGWHQIRLLSTAPSALEQEL